MKKHLLFNQLFGTEGNPNQTGETLAPSDERAMTERKPRGEKEQLSSTCLRSASVLPPFRSRYLRYAAMIFAVLVMSIANIGTAWGDTTILDYTLPDLTSSTTIDASETGFTVKADKIGGANGSGKTDKYTTLSTKNYYKWASSWSYDSSKSQHKGSWILFTLSSGTFQTGDIVHYTIYPAKAITDGLKTTGGTGSGCSTSASEAVEGTITLAAADNGKDTLRLIRVNSNCYINRIWVTRAASCTAPNHVDISGNYHFFPGETLELTATAYSTADTSNPIAAGDITGYQWQKYIGSTWTNIAGETSSTYTKANATTSDVGQYRCIVSTGATCSTTSDTFNAKCLQLYVYWDNKSDKCNLPFTKVDGTHATVNVSLENGSYTYYYKVTDGCGNWWGNDGTMTSGNCSGWNLNVDNHCGLTTTKAAAYTFNLTYNAGVDAFSMSVVYPSTVQTGGYNLYFANDERNWSNIHYRIGRSNWNSKAAMTLVPGTANLYQTTTIHYENDGGFEAWHIANNGGWSNGNSIYKTNTGDGNAITNATRFEGAPVPSTGLTVIPGSDHSTGGDDQNNNCEFYSFTTVPGMWTHNVSITPPSHGTLTVNYITTTGEGTAFNSGNRDLAHTVNYCVTAEEGIGYTVASITINGTPVENRSWHVLTEDVVVAATFTLADYTITHSAASNGTYTIKVGDAAAVSTNTTANYGQTVTLAASPSEGYELSSWTVTKAGGGTVDVVSNQFSMPNDNVTITATFALKTYTITYNAGTGDITGSHANDTKTHGVNLTLPGATFSKTGYTQTGWATSDGGSQAYALSASYTANAAANLYPVWTAKTTAITLDKNNSDESGSTNGSVTATYGSSSLTSLVHATRTGYTIDGYQTEGKVKIIKADGTLNSSKDGYTSGTNWIYEGSALTLYAVWKANKFNVTHTLSNVSHSSGGEAGSDKATYGTAYSVTFAASSGYTLPDAVTVTVGGSNVTANCTWNQGTGVLTIPAAYVTGNIVISVTGVAAVVSYATSIDFEAFINRRTTSGAWKDTIQALNYTVSQVDGSKWSLDNPDKKPADKGLKIKETGDNAGKITFTVRANQTVELKVGTLAGTNAGKAKFSTDGGSSYSNITGAATASTGTSVVTTYTGATDRTYVFKTSSANWNILQHIIIGYKITYDKGANGTGTIDPMYKTHGTNINLSSSTFTYAGHTQDGWSTSDGGSKVYELGASYTTDAPVTLYPHWVEDAATISATLESDTYMRTGASGVQIGVEITGAGDGWKYRVRNGTGGYETPDNTTYTTTTWTMTSTIGPGTNTYTVELYNGSGTKVAESNAVTVTGETGHPMTIAAGANGTVSPSGLIYANGEHLNPEISATPASGYHFVNWTKDNENATLANANAATTTITSASGACTITANFAADVVGYTVTYKYNGATSGASPTSATGASVTLPTPTRTGYVLDGWYTTAGEKVEDGGETYVPEADITLYARWQEACDAEGVAKSTTDVASTGYTTYQEKGGDKVVFTDAPTLGFKYKNAAGNTINNSTTAVVRNNAYKCQISSDSGNKGSIKTNSTFSNVDSISFYFAASDKGGCKIAVWCSTDNFSTDSTSLLSATTYADNNSEFKLKTLAIPSDKKASALRFKFRFTVTSSGKTSYIDSLKVYSSTTGGSTCYHVYYHGNGAESGYVNDTVSYTAGSKATVLNYNYGRYPLAKAGNDFQGWATSAGGAVAYTAGQKIDITSADVHLYAKWAPTSTALVTWEKKVNVATWTDNTTPSTTNPTNIGTIGSSATLIASPGATSGKTPQIQLASGASNADKGASFTFSMKSADKVVVPTKVSCEVANVGGESNGDITYKAVLTDGAGNTYYSTNSICPNNNGTLNPIDFVFSSGLSLRGDITVKVYAWLSGSGSGFSFRMGPDVKFYGTVDDYACATPSAPTISGVSEYAVGQAITLTASHDGENYDNLTTYTWYRGANWATASAASPVQDADTGEDGYTLTKTAVAADDDLFWCKVSNGTCEAHNTTGYNVNVYAANTITWHLNDGEWGEVEHKDSYSRFDDDYTLPIPSKDGYVFAGWYEASDFSGLPISTLESGSVGDREYWAKWGSAVTATWTITKVDDALYRGGGGYSVTAVINQADWDDYGDKDDLVLTATEGVTLKNVVKSINGEGKAQVFANFDITTGLEADATEITFTLDVPANGTYAPAELSHGEDLTDCGGGASGYTEFFSMIPKANTCSITNTEANSAPNHFTTCECTSSATITAGGSVTYGLYSSGTGATSKYWEYNDKNGGWKHSIANSWVVLYSTDQFKAGDSIVITNGNSSSSGYYTIVASASNNTADYHSVSQVAAPSTTSPAKNTNYYYKLPASFVSSNYLVIRSSTSSSCYVGTIKAYHAGAKGGVTPTLSWTPALASDGDWDSENNRLNKETGDVDFTFVAGQDKNSLGTITYSSNNPSVATVNAAGTVHIVGAAGDATITATLAASGCFGEATATYNIQVVDNCIDEPGTISTTDLGCSGIEMTVSGHTTSGETVNYQWYKVGTPDEEVGTNSATFTTTEAGEYYVVVTNTGTDHCSMASTNTVKVASKATATATKIVDSWYVKNGRRTPDVALVQTAGATGFIVKSGETTIWNSDSTTTTGFGGCGFHMGTDGIIYLNGTKDDGDATTDLTAGDVTLKITANDGCGSSASELSITIHCQEATIYKEIAFVVDGDKGKDFDQVTSGHAAGTELYEYLDSVTVYNSKTGNRDRLFQLTEQNIYSTTDEKAIRQHYSQYDAILITDDPSTNKVPNSEDYKTKGYVNAFGTMIDVRPIFTMEAYVSALKNWGSKGIKGNPQSPNPRQYEMRLECKDHEIYGSGLPEPSDGTNVWEEVIGGETFRHVILVDSTKGIYNGVAYNAQTAGKEKPALQGFTGEAAGSLLGLGRISNGSLQAAIERQEEPAARLLVMGINAKALQPTCALTNEGKVVIRNILTYLLKTNMEEVDDCSNYFTGEIDNDWNKAGNWSKDALPSSEAKVRILAPCVISGVQPHVAQVAIVSSGESGIRGSHRSGEKTCNGKLTINANGALIVGGKVLAAEAPHFAANNLKPTTVEDLIINTNGSGQAALIFDNEKAETKATVNLYSLGRRPSSYQYQYFAVPMEVVPVNPTFANETHGGTGIYTYVYEEATSGWTRRKYYDDLFAFEGLGITTKSTVAMEYEMTGNLASTATKEITLTHNGRGLNLIGNSWMAPIQIAALAEDNADLDNKTAYIYCAGRDAVEGAATEGDAATETAGQWIPIPFEASGTAGWREAGKLSVIPAMQAFEIKVSDEATLTLDYKKVVRGSTNDLNAKLRAPGRRMAANEVTMTNIRVADSKTHTDLSLFEGDRFSEAFDNGWEAEYMNGDGRSAKLYAETEAGQMAVAAMYDYEGTVVGFAPGKETEYTFSFMGEDNGYYLNDIKLQNSVRIREGETYTFTFEEGDAANRFYISRTAINAPAVATGMENLDAAAPRAQKIIYNDKLYIIRGGRLYDATGKVVK